MNDKPIVLIGGARPNFMKLAPLCHELTLRKLPFVLINAGQHADANMNSDFFEEFGIQPTYSLTPHGKNPQELVASMEHGLRRLLEKTEPALVVVAGDVNATAAGARAARALRIPIAHVEAGLRSGNMKMQEEHNRIEVDRLSSFLFVTEESGVKNLRGEAVGGKIIKVGNIMLDMVRRFLPRLKARTGTFYFVTLHRAENVDDKETFSGILDALAEISEDAELILPLHPRTKKQAEAFGFMERMRTIFTLLPPLSYTDALSYERFAALVLTDSGGIQEETSFLGTPCITLRDETERPVTVEKGTNVIGGTHKDSILEAYTAYKASGFSRRAVSIPLWDGKVAKRIVEVLERSLKT